MATERLYIETISDQALNITEDIVHLNNAMNSLNQLSTSYVDKDRRYEVFNLLSTLERECRFYFRNVYLQGNTGKIYDSLRNRLKEELRKEGYYFYDNADGKDRQDSTSNSECAATDASGEGWEEPPF